MTYTITFEATIQVHTTVDAASYAQAEAFAAAVLDGSSLTTTDELVTRWDEDSLEYTGVIDIQEKD